MPQRSARETVVFLHVPKAGGQTLRSILGRVHGADAILDHRGPLSDEVVLDADWDRVRLVEGHLVHGVGDQVPGPTAYVTVLRDPVERVVSLHRYIRRNPRHHLHEQVREMALAEFVASDLDRVEVVNGQTRQIAGTLRDDPDEATLEVALANLADMAVAGVVEDLDPVLLLLRRRFGWPMPWYASRNVSRDRSPVTRQDRETVAALNVLDQRLWEAARQRQHRDAASAGPAFSASLVALRLGTRLIGRLRR